jgi:gliding motility-associated-like protein
VISRIASFFVVFVLLLFVRPSIGQIKVINPCFYKAAPTNIGANTATGTMMMMPADLNKIYNISTTFIDQDKSSTTSNWDFGDTTFAIGRVVSHKYKRPGNYTVVLTKNTGQTETKIVAIKEAPATPYFTSTPSKLDTAFCGITTLDPYKGRTKPNGVSYLWYPSGETSSTLNITKSFNYKLRVTDADGCEITASLKATICGDKAMGGAPSIAFNDTYKLEAASLIGGIGAFSNNNFTCSVQNPNLLKFNKNILNTDGNVIKNDMGGVLVTGLLPIGQLAINTVAVPKIEQEDMVEATKLLTIDNYYVFSLSDKGQLYYSNILEAKEDTLRKLTNESVIFLQKGLNGKMTISKFSPNSNDYQLMVQDSTGKFYRYTINELGVQGPSLAFSSVVSNKFSQIKFNQQVTRFAHAVNTATENYLEVCDVSSSGQVSNCTKLASLGNGSNFIYGLEWPFKGEFLYYTIQGNSPTLGRVELSNRKNQQIAQKQNNTELFGGLQYYDGFGQANNQHILVNVVGIYQGLKHIELPDQPDMASWNNSLVDLLTRSAQIGYSEVSNRTYISSLTVNNSSNGLFNFVVNPAKSSSGKSNALTYTVKCEGDNVEFTGSSDCDADNKDFIYQWDFGDGSASVQKIGSAGEKVTHSYSSPGQKKVSLTIVYCNSKTSKQEKLIQVLAKAKYELKMPYENCFLDNPTLEDKGIVLNQKNIDSLTIYQPKINYKWTSPAVASAKDPTKFSIKKQGNFGVELSVVYEVDDKTTETCLSTAQGSTLNSCPFFIIPDVLTPNADGYNDALILFSDKISNINFKFRIYNRWGDLVYFSNDKDKINWNGTYNGEKLKPDTFTWSANYESTINPGVRIKRTGPIKLVY